jgi:tetratricopeptide (TPR) repeat protein
MQRLSCLCFLLGVVLVFSAAAQKPAADGGGGTGGRPTGGASGTRTTISPRPTMPVEQPRPLFISGKVVVDDGSELTDRALIQSTCKGRRHIEGNTDSHGNFSIELGRANNFVDQEIDSDIGNSPTDMFSRTQVGRRWNDCQLQAVLPGFISQVIELGMVHGEQNTNVGRIVLRRLARVEGFTLSATSAAAPEDARKAFGKGRELAEKRKWDKAEEKLQQAVQIYPRYAVAWNELGRVQLQKNNRDAAQMSFRRALDADSKLVTPHQHLARMAFEQKNWQDVIDHTRQVLSLNPTSFPHDWLLNAVANYLLNQYDEAERSARQGLKADAENQVPKLEYVLGLALLHRRDLAGAQEHVKNYVRLAPNDPDIPKVQQQIAELEKAAGASAAATNHR